MRKYLMVFMFLMSSIGLSYAGGVTDNNNGNEGYLFVSTGENSGNNSVGHWTDPSSISSLKGDKGDTGEDGTNGLNGTNGVDGRDGINGLNGANGIDGVDGKNGLDGKNGKRGKKGDTGSAGENGSNGLNGNDGVNGVKGETGANGKDVDPAIVQAQNNKINANNKRIHQLERPQEIVGAEVRVYDGKKWTITTFVDYSSTRNNVDRAGVRFTYKVGESYEERRINKLEAKVNHLLGFQQGREETPTGEMYTDGSSVGYRERF